MDASCHLCALCVSPYSTNSEGVCVQGLQTNQANCKVYDPIAVVCKTCNPGYVGNPCKQIPYRTLANCINFNFDF